MIGAPLLAGGGPGGPGIWGQAVVIALIAAVGGVATTLVGVWLKRMNRPVDDATVLKTHVEAEKIRAEVDRARIDNDGREVEIARGLLDDIRKELDRYRAEIDRTRESSERRLAEQAEIADNRYRELSDDLMSVRGRQQELERQLEEHIPWDIAARTLLREVRPEFPDPPPISYG